MAVRELRRSSAIIYLDLNDMGGNLQTAFSKVFS